MSKSDDNIRKRNFIEAGKLHFKNKYLSMDPAKFLLKKLDDIDEAMWKTQCQPILKAGGYKDKESLRFLIFNCYFQTFDSAQNFTKEELVAALVHVHTNIMMGRVEENPGGGDTPNLMG